MRYTAHHRIIALILAMMLFAFPLSPAAFAESPELLVDTQTVQTPDEAPVDLTDQMEEDILFASTTEPAAEATAEPTVEPTAEATAEPTAEQTAEVTAEPAIEPTVELTQEPTAEPVPEAPVRQTVRDVLAAGGYPYVTGVPMTLYADAELTQPVYTVTGSDAIFMVTGIVEQDGLNSMEVWLLNLDYELIVAYASADTLQDMALSDTDVQAMAQERLSAMVFAANDEFIVFVAEGEAVLPDEPPVEENPVLSPMPEDMLAKGERQESTAPVDKQIGEFILVTPNTRVFMDVDDWASDEYLGDLYIGQFIRDAAVQIVEIKQDSLGRTWYVVDYLYGPDEGDGLICEIISTVHVLADETQETDAQTLTATDVVLPKGYSTPTLLASTDFSLRDNYGGVASFYVGESDLHATTGHDNEYLQIARHDEYGTIYATPHYLKGETAYCLEHTQNSPAVRDHDSGPYTIVDLEGYRVTPGHSGYIFSDKTMHALAWVLRHTYPFMVLDRSDSDNAVWSRVAGQFAMREVVKQIEGAYYVREYWEMDEFYRPYDYAPGVYLEYARWLAQAALDYADTLPTITVYDKSVTYSGNQYVGTATLYTSAEKMRISKDAGTISGNSGGDDWDYYYLYSGDTISITSQNSTFSLTAEALPSANDEAKFYIGVTNADIQKLLLPAYGDPYPVAKVNIEFEVPHGAVKVVKQRAQTGALLPGAVFELLNSSGSVVQTQTTGADGSAAFANLTPGTYTVREKAAPQGYQLDVTNMQNVTVTAGSTSSVTFTNDVMTSKIRIEKKDALTGSALPSAAFTITRLSGAVGVSGVGSEVAMLTTGADGTAETDWLEWGRYRIEETGVPAHYVNSGYVAEIDAHENGKTYTFTVPNEPAKGYIQIVKTDALDQMPIEGVQFDIYYADDYGDGLAATITTNKDGLALSEPLRKGRYIVREHENPTGYVTELVELSAEVQSDETTNLSASNQPIQGWIQIVKTDALTGEALSGAEFTITRVHGLPSHKGGGDDEVVATIVTDENGIATSPLLTWGTYRVDETKVPEHFVDNSFSAEVVIDTENLQTYTVEVANEPTKGFIRLTKTDRLNGNPIKGVQFDIYYDDQYGEGLAASMVTDANGIAVSEPLRKGQYIVREHGATAGYVFEEIELNVTVKPDETTELAVTNQPVQVQLRIMKRDTEEAQQNEDKATEFPPSTRGDGVLTGAEFQLIAGDTIKDRQGNVLYRKDEVVIPSLTTEGDEASVLTPMLWPGLYKVLEINPPTGYHPSEKRVTIDARDAAKHSDQAVFLYEGIKTNKIRYGAQAIIKILGPNENEVDPDRVEVPEEGAEFLVYLKKAGSYEAAREFERDHLVTNARGYAKTKELPYGIYTLEQIKGAEGYEMKGKIDFMITGEEDTYNPPILTLSDRPILYRLKLTKVDAETGLPIILTNTSFKIRDSEGNYVTQTLHYPNEAQIDTYITDDTGSVMLPQTLNWGLYTIEEVHSPTGYLALDEGFSIFVGSAGDMPDNVYEVNVKIPNEPVKGRILVEKKGLQFTGVQVITDGYGHKIHQPVYEERYLAGATFEVRAADDVVGGDGTIWYRQGDLADTITTTGSGSDASKVLPLGRYVLVETGAPDGYALDSTPHEVELAYMDNRTPLVEMSVRLENAYLSAEIALSKEKEVLQTEERSDGSVYRKIAAAPGEGFVFGLFTDNDLHFDGGAIMAGSLVATGVTDADGCLTFSGCFPHGQYTLRELSAPEGWLMSAQAYPIVLDPAAVSVGETVIRATLEEPILNALNRFAVTLTKTDITGSQTVPGAQIEVLDETGNVIYLAVTDENGEIADIPVTPGRYTFSETLAPEGYALSEAELTFEVDKDGNVTGNTTIRDDYTRVSVLKQNENGLPMAGVEFSLLDASGNVRMTAISDMNGLATFERIPYGKYTITETKPLPGYFRSGVSVDLTVDGSFVNPTEPLATITNHPMRIECIKVDNSGRALPGVEFSLIDARTDTIVEIVTSDEQGRFVFDAIDYGSWIIRETCAPEGYRVMEDVHLEIGEDFVQPEPITLTNIPNHYEFMKVDEQNRPLAGVTFALEDGNGNVLRELVSGEDGIVHADGLDFGSYVIRETQALEGYRLTEETIAFTVDENYTDPPELYCLVNERKPITAVIQTGLDFVMTPMTWIGAGLVLAGVAVMGIYSASRKRKKHG